MNITRAGILRFTLIALSAVVAFEGTMTMIRWRGVPLILTEQGSTVRIKRITRLEGIGMIQPGDMLVAIGGKQVTRLSEAMWQFASYGLARC